MTGVCWDCHAIQSVELRLFPLNVWYFTTLCIFGQLAIGWFDLKKFLT